MSFLPEFRLVWKHVAEIRRWLNAVDYDNSPKVRQLYMPLKLARGILLARAWYYDHPAFILSELNQKKKAI